MPKRSSFNTRQALPHIAKQEDKALDAWYDRHPHLRTEHQTLLHLEEQEAELHKRFPDLKL